jgi:hypothetical protein
MMKTILKVLGLLLCALLLLKGNSIWYDIFPKGKKFGVAFNKERQERGIPILPEDWVTKNNASYIKAWFPPDSSHGATYRSMKLTRIEDDKLVYEEDHIVHDGPGDREVLSIGYNYDSTSHWKCSYSTWKRDSKKVSLTKEQADSVLASWSFTIKQINRSK